MAICVKASELKQAFREAKNLVNLKDRRPLPCNALRFDFKGNTCRIVATDNFRIGVWELSCSGEGCNDFTIAYPRPLMDFGDSESVFIGYENGEKAATFRGENVNYQPPVLEDRYLNWERLKDEARSEELKIRFNRKKLIDLLKSISDNNIVLSVHGETGPVVITNIREGEWRLMLPQKS